MISRHFIWKLIIWRLSSGKTIILQISLICVLNNFLINCIHLKLLLRMQLKEMFLLNRRPWEVFYFKFKRSFKNCLRINRRLDLKIVFASPATFFTFKDKLPKMLLSRLAYKYKCGGCNAYILWKDQNHFKVRIYESLGISHFTGKKLKMDNNKLLVIQDTSYVTTSLHPLKTFLFWPGKVMILNWK